MLASSEQFDDVADAQFVEVDALPAGLAACRPPTFRKVSSSSLRNGLVACAPSATSSAVWPCGSADPRREQP